MESGGNPEKRKNKKNVYFALILIISFSVLLFLASGPLARIGPMHEFLSERKIYGRASLSDVEHIKPWMTFKYINSTFNLPENYLKDKLGIIDRNYPDSVVGKCAKEQASGREEFTEKVKSAVREYLEQRK